MERWVVVGGGAAGCVVAARLSDRSDAHVTLLEAGRDHGDAPQPGDVGPFLVDIERTRVEQVVRRPGRAPEPYWQGSGLGGSSIVNASVVTGTDRAVETGRPTDLADLPMEPPWSVGAVGAGLLASDDRATPVALVRSGRRRLTAADIHLRPVLDRPHLDVRCNAPVREVLLDGRRAAGVMLEDGSTIDADRVVLCAGAIRTPTLLLRSGVDVPGLGERVQDHPAFTIALRLRDGAIDPTTPTISVCATHRHHQVLALDHLPDAPGLGALTVGLLDVVSEGHIRLDAAGEPVVELRQLTDATDRARLVAGVVDAVRRLEHAAWASVFDEAFLDDAGTAVSELMADPERIEPYVLAHAGGHFHVSGSCRDGTVTDGGAVRGYAGLYVGDASALPGVPRLDPYVIVMRQAERLARSW